MKRNILIVYYSYSGNTYQVAKLIHQQVGGSMVEIQPEVQYPTAYNAVVEQAKKEIQAGFRPSLKTEIGDIGVYDAVFVGTPNWWSAMAPPIATFFEEYDFSGKTIMPFCTHGGGGLARIERDMAKLCPDTTILPGLAIYGSGGRDADSQISAWLRRIDFTEK